MRKELTQRRIHDKRMLAKSATIYDKVKQRLKEEKEEEEDKLKHRQKGKRMNIRNSQKIEYRDETEEKRQQKRDIKRRTVKRGRRKEKKRRRGGKRRRKNKKKRRKRKRGKRRKLKGKFRTGKKVGRRLNRLTKKQRLRQIKKIRKKKRKGGKSKKKKKRKRKKRKIRREKGKRRRRRKRKRKIRRKRRRRRRKRKRKRRKRRRKMRKRMRKLRIGRKSSNLQLVEILKRLNQADYRAAAIRGTPVGLANRLIRLLTRAHRVARSWKSLRRRWPLVRTVKAFTVLLRRSERIIASIKKSRTSPRRRRAVKRRLKLALLYIDAVGVDLRRATDMLRARTGQRVLAMLQLAVRTQRDAIWQAIYGTSRRPQKQKLQRMLLHALGGRGGKQSS